MPPHVSSVFVALMLTLSLNGHAQMAAPVSALSPAELMVQSMGLAPMIQTFMKAKLADPRPAQAKKSRDMAVAQKMVRLSESDMQSVIARVLETGVSPADLSEISAFYASEVGRKFAGFSRQVATPSGDGTAPNSVVQLAKLTAQLSDNERKALEAHVSSGAPANVARFVDSPKFEAALMAEVEAFAKQAP